MNVIFGSGIVGLMAKAILGDAWKVVPFYRSRFFSFDPALDDNFIIRDDNLDPVIRDLFGLQSPRMLVYKRAWSVGGQLIRDFNLNLCRDWLTKIFGSQVPSQAEIYLHNRMDLFIYDLRANKIYQQLMEQYLPDLKQEASLGAVSQIGDHFFVRNGKREDFENAISTIPLDKLATLCGVKLDLPSKAVHFLHLKTDYLDFEGFNQVLLTDQLFSFYKVTNIAPKRYLFYCHEEIPHPGVYFMPIIQGDFDILDGTSIASAIPLGQIPSYDFAEKRGIFCVGRYAQWDWCMDVGSCVLRLIRYSQRGHKAKTVRKEVKL